MLVEQETVIVAQKWRQKHPSWWRLIIGLIAFFVTIMILMGGLFAFVNTSIGKNYIAAQIKAHTHDHIEIQGLTGFFPSHLKIAEIQFKNDDVGVWLDIKQVQLNWSPLALLKGNLTVQSLIAKEVNFEALPPKKVQEQGNVSKSERRLVNMPLTVDIQHLQIDQLFISDKVAKRNIYIAVDGQVKIRDLSQMIDLDTLKAAFMTKPKFRLFGPDKPADFQFGGKISGSMERKDGGDYSASLVPLHFSVILPQADQNSDKIHIYLGLGDKL